MPDDNRPTTSAQAIAQPGQNQETTMPMHTVKSGIPVCECCLIALANADTSGCEYTCGDDHVSRLCQWGTDPGEEIVPEGGRDDINGDMVRCFGCGDDAMQGGTVAILTTF